MIQLQSAQDVFLWPDGTNCYREEYEEGAYLMMGDDYEVLAVGTDRYREFND